MIGCSLLNNECLNLFKSFLVFVIFFIIMEIQNFQPDTETDPNSE